MNFELWLAFVVASSVLLIIPGPTILTVISYSLKHGPKATAPLVLAVALGDAIAVTVSLLGLGALLATSAFLFSLVKIIGGLYLIYLGLSFLFSESSTEETTKLSNASNPANQRPDAIFINTFLITALNPKGIVFFVAFLPQFIDRGLALTPQLTVLAITFVMLGALNAAGYAFLANRASRQLKAERIKRKMKIASGTLLSLAGIWTLASEQS